MRSRLALCVVMIAAAVAAATVAVVAADRAQGGSAPAPRLDPDLLEGRRAHPPEELPGLPSAR